MNTADRRAAIATISLLAYAAVANGQARYEIGYQFNDQPEVVRVESFPFTVSEAFATDPFQKVAGIFPVRFAGSGLVFPLLSQSARSDVEVERLTAIRMQLGVQDLIFSSDQADPIEVDLNLDFGDGHIIVCFTFGCVGIEYLSELEVTVNGDTREGRSMATLDGTREPIRERCGLLINLGETSVVRVEGLTVPVNEPVSMTIEYRGSIRFPVGVWGGSAAMNPGSRGLGFAVEGPIFTVPDGVRVDSVNGRIRDNQYVPCFADLDADGALTVFDFLIYQQLFEDQDFLADLDRDSAFTIFDFLAFQNAFDAGCP